MSKSDPFTSDNARIREKSQDAPTEQLRRLRAVYGPAADLRFLKYTGNSGEWQAGYYSNFGFHIEGRDVASPSRAVDIALANHAQDSASTEGRFRPTPEHPNPQTSWRQRNPTAFDRRQACP